MSVKWIITDIDGCLTPEESEPWDIELFGRVAQLSREASAGRGSLAPMTLCTGRPQPYVEALMKVLDIRAPAICESGAVLYSIEDNRSRYGAGVTEEKLLGLRAVRAFIETDILPAEPGVLLQFGKEAHISVYSSRPEVFASLRGRIQHFAEQRGGPDLIIDATSYYLNISLAGVNKGNAIQNLLVELEATRDEVAGIGDAEGDLPLCEAVGFFACPANATPALKAVADYVSPYPTLEGMLDILGRPELQRAQA